jgi:hypothetical protein
VKVLDLFISETNMTTMEELLMPFSQLKEDLEGDKEE